MTQKLYRPFYGKNEFEQYESSLTKGKPALTEKEIKEFLFKHSDPIISYFAKEVDS